MNKHLRTPNPPQTMYDVFTGKRYDSIEAMEADGWIFGGTNLTNMSDEELHDALDLDSQPYEFFTADDFEDDTPDDGA